MYSSFISPDGHSELLVCSQTKLGFALSFSATASNLELFEIIHGGHFESRVFFICMCPPNKNTWANPVPPLSHNCSSAPGACFRFYTGLTKKICQMSLHGQVIFAFSQVASAVNMRTFMIKLCTIGGNYSIIQQ